MFPFKGFAHHVQRIIQIYKSQTCFSLDSCYSCKLMIGVVVFYGHGDFAVRDLTTETVAGNMIFKFKRNPRPIWNSASMEGFCCQLMTVYIYNRLHLINSIISRLTFLLIWKGFLKTFVADSGGHGCQTFIDCYC